MHISQAVVTLIFTLRRYYRAVWGMVALARKDRRTPFPIPLSTRLRMWSMGFLGESQVIYDLGHNPPSAYLSDFRRLVRTPGINRRREVLNDKLLFETMFRALLPIPRGLAWMSPHGVVSLSNAPLVSDATAIWSSTRSFQMKARLTGDIQRDVVTSGVGETAPRP